MFNWVSKKFHYDTLIADTTPNMEQGLLKLQFGEIIDELHKWKINGSVTICRVGFQKPSKPRDFEYFLLGKENKRDHDEVKNTVDEELNPLLSTTFENKFDDGDEFCTALEKLQVIMAMDRRIRSSKITEKKKSGGPRVTLADLLMADSDVKPAKLQHDLQKFPDVHANSFDKKLNEELKPTRNFRAAMRKMMTRKIHSEIDEKLMETGER